MLKSISNIPNNHLSGVYTEHKTKKHPILLAQAKRFREKNIPYHWHGNSLVSNYVIFSLSLVSSQFPITHVTAFSSVHDVNISFPANTFLKFRTKYKELITNIKKTELLKQF
ncbi:MAG: hypothetical protein IT271_06525 [Chitinophagales bacterium]|nr:hypothetical protein [Chitinophagales bacterium]